MVSGRGRCREERGCPWKGGFGDAVSLFRMEMEWISHSPASQPALLTVKDSRGGA